jgi:hypothetical protein
MAYFGEPRHRRVGNVVDLNLRMLSVNPPVPGSQAKPPVLAGQ